MKKIIIFALSLIMVIGLGFAFTQYGIGMFRIEEKSELNVSSVLEKVTQISQLDTVEMHFSEILDYQSALSINGFDLPFTEKKFIFTVKAKVQSGIDLASLTEENIQITDKKIALTLNRAKITSKEILEYRAFSEVDGIGNPVTTEDTLNTLNNFTERLEKQALENGILEKAEENAKLVLENFLILIGFEEVVITFKD